MEVRKVSRGFGTSPSGEAAGDNDALSLLRTALRKPPELKRLVSALIHLDPIGASTWLLEDEARARERLDAADLRRVVEAVIPRLVHTGTSAEGRIRELIRRYLDVLGSESLTLAVSKIFRHEPDPELRGLLDQALARGPGHPDLLQPAAELAALAGDGPEAHRLLTRLGELDPSPARLHYIRRKRAALPRLERPPVRIALMSSFTIEPVIHCLDLECRLLGLEPEIYVTPFNSWAREIFDPESDLRRFDPEISFLSVSVDDLIPALVGAPSPGELEEAGSDAVEHVLEVAQRFTTWTDSLLVVHGFHSGYRDPHGILQDRSGPSRTEWLASLNLRLAAELRSLPNAYLLDVMDLLLRRPGGELENRKMRHLASIRLSGAAAREVARAYARYIAPLKGLTRKCVVLDLDNTLWGGVVGEDGPEGIRLGETAPGSEYREFQSYLLSLTERGFLLAVNSKNNEEDALEVIRSHDAMILREEAFAAMRINWRPKPENMESIARELNIGVDSMVFVDDDPHQRELMRQALPQILTPELPPDPSLYRAQVEGLPQLQKLVVTDVDRNRTAQYRSRRQRQKMRSQARALDEYLHSLDIGVEIGEADTSSLQRVHQLFERTNQFNLTARRHAASRLTSLASDPAWRLYTLRARDRFGDHGLVATALVATGPEEWRIDSLMMSCRVIGYGIETSLLATIAEDARASGARRLIGEYIETPKNEPARDFYSRHGFLKQECENGVERWHLTADQPAPQCPAWILRQDPGDA